jgi:hypothetical protein
MTNPSRTAPRGQAGARVGITWHQLEALVAEWHWTSGPVLSIAAVLDGMSRAAAARIGGMDCRCCPDRIAEAAMARAVR